MVELMSILERDTVLKRVATTGGGEWAGACPLCGGTDRFRVQPNKKDGGRWFCRGCGESKWHDVYDYVMRRDHITFPQARRLVDGDNQNWKPITPRAPELAKIEREYDLITWREKAAAFISYCESQLFEDVGKETLDWLLSRGITEDVIIEAQLGFNPADVYYDADKWGFPSTHNKVYLSHGLIIPNIDQTGIHAIKVRRADQEPKKKYILVKGSEVWMYGGWTCKHPGAAFLFESELDALLGYSTGYGLGYLALPAGQAIHPHYEYILDSQDYVVVMPDNDEPGMKHADKLSRIERFFVGKLPPEGKDITEFYLSSGQDNARLLDFLYDCAGEIAP